MTDDQDEDVRSALAILRAAGFPVERVRIMPVTGDAREARQDSEAVFREVLLEECLRVLEGGRPWSARDLAQEVGTVASRKVMRKDVNGVLYRFLSAEGKDRLIHDPERHTFCLLRQE